MDRLEHLLTIAAEECAEIAQRISKAQRFGLDEIQPGQGYDNAERINEEFNDLIAVLRLIERETGRDLTEIFGSSVRKKQRKVEEFLELSKAEGRLS
jgi:NTP pyrophosphatase (non-canonical NTP hydrolase)